MAEISKKGFLDQFDFRGLIGVDVLLTSIQYQLKEIPKTEYIKVLQRMIEKANASGFIRLSENIQEIINQEL